MTNATLIVWPEQIISVFYKSVNQVAGDPYSRLPAELAVQQSDRTEVATTSLLSVNDDGKTVSINPDPEVFYVERDGSSNLATPHHVIEVEVRLMYLCD